MEPLQILLRLGLAAVLGAIVAGLHHWSKRSQEGLTGLSSTILLLAPLIAMVTMAVGDNVAAAFTLVGTLAIVRFRTAIRDPQDTAYVIFSVAVGLASGNMNREVALLGTLVVGILVGLLRCMRAPSPSGPRFTLRMVLVPADAQAAEWQQLLSDRGLGYKVVESKLDRSAKSLSLSLALDALESAAIPELMVALLALPAVQTANCRPLA